MAKIRDLFHVNACPLSNDISYLEKLNLLMNAVTIKGIDNVTIENFVKQNLIELGKIGYDKLTDKWANVYGEGLDEIGRPTNLTFVFRNGKSFVRRACYDDNANGTYIINALPYPFSLGELIRETTTFTDNCKIAMRQNIDAIKTPYIVVSKNKDLQLSLEHAIEQKLDGKPVIVVNEDLGDALKSIDVNVPYVADKLQEICNQWEDKLLNKLGTMSANINKKERVQVGEVNATTGQCSDYIYMFIDNVNKQFDTFGIDCEMVINNSLEELYEEGTPNNETIESEVVTND